MRAPVVDYLIIINSATFTLIGSFISPIISILSIAALIGFSYRQISSSQPSQILAPVFPYQEVRLKPTNFPS